MHSSGYGLGDGIDICTSCTNMERKQNPPYQPLQAFASDRLMAMCIEGLGRSGVIQFFRRCDHSGCKHAAGNQGGRVPVPRMNFAAAHARSDVALPSARLEPGESPPESIDKSSATLDDHDGASKAHSPDCRTTHDEYDEKPPLSLLRETASSRVIAQLDISQSDTIARATDIVKDPRHPHSCHCGLSFPLRKTLLRHQQTVHSQARYKCPLCSAQFKRKDIQTRHVEEQHSRNGWPSTVLCPHCGKGIRRRLLKEHMRSRGCFQTATR